MNTVVKLLTWHKNVQCVTRVERGMAAAPCRLFLLCISNLRASEQNSLVLFVTTCIMCTCEKYLLFHLRCQTDSIGTFFFFLKCWKNSGRVVIVMILLKGGGDFSPLYLCCRSCWQSSVTNTSGGGAFCWNTKEIQTVLRLLGEKLFCLCFCILKHSDLWMLYFINYRTEKIRF